MKLMLYKQTENFFDLNNFLVIAIFSLLYVNTFSDSQNLIELAISKLKDPSFLPFDLVINSYENNPLTELPISFFYLYSLLLPFDENFLFLNFSIKTLTVYGIYLIYRYFITNKLICLIASLIHLSPSIKILPYIADWYVVSPALHTNSLFFLFFVYFIWGLIYRKYYLVFVLQVFALASHPPLGLFLAFPVMILFYTCFYIKDKELLLNQLENRFRLAFPMMVIFINLLYLVKIILLNNTILDPKELTNIFSIHAPHHYLVSSISFLKLAWPYFFIVCSYLALIRIESDTVLRLFLLILVPLILLSVPLHFIFSEIFPSTYIYSLHLMRSASVLSALFLAPYFLMFFSSKAWRPSDG